MATTQQLRSAVAELTGLAQVDIRTLYSGTPTPERLKEALADVLPALVQEYGLAAAALGADWYDEIRLESGVGGSFLADPAPVPAVGAEALAGYAVGPLFQAEPDYESARVLLDGGLQRRIANVARETVMQASYADPGARGWQRSASGGCAFCQMIAGRGAVFSERSANFASHDGCRCQAVPAFNGQPIPVKPYTPSERRVSDADRARVRKYLRDNPAASG